MAEKPPYAPNVVNQTVSYKGVTWKGNPGSDWTIEGGGGGASSVGGINDYLANYTKQTLGTLGPNVVDASGNVNFAEIKSALTPTSVLPPTINRAQMYADLRQSQGVAGLEETLTNLKAAQMEVYGQLDINRAAERGKPVAQNVIEGRISEETQQAQQQADFLARQISTVTDQLNTSYNVINTFINFAGLDYNDAVTRYNTEFTQNMSVLNLVQSTRSAGVQEYGTLKGIELQQAQLDQQIKQDAENNARANLQIMMNAITAGNMSPDKLSSDQKLQLTKLETQAGLPAGFTSSLQMSTKDKILFTSSNNGVTQVGMQNADGTISIQSYGTAQGTATQKKQTYISNAQEDAAKGATLKQLIQINQGYLDPNEVYQVYNANSKWGPATETRDQLAKYGITIPVQKTDPITGQPID